MDTYTPTQIVPPTANGTQSADGLSRAIIHAILSGDDHQYKAIDLALVGIYAPGLKGMIKAYESGGVAVAKLALDNLLEADPKFRALVASSTDVVEISPIDQAPAIPELPEEARLAPVSIDSVSPWLADYIRYSQRYSPEGYKDFHVSCGLWVLSTVAARRVCIPLSKPTYTALAIALVARTSLFAKSVTAFAGISVLEAAGLKWLMGDDETTPQALLADMAGEVPANYSSLDDEEREDNRKRVALSGQLGWYYDEFNQLVNAMTRPGPMAEFAGLLRKLDNFPERHRVRTRSHGKEVIKKPYLAFCASTTPANLARHATKGGEFWGDGFWARFAFITPPVDAFVTDTMQLGKVTPPDHLSRRLREWNDRLGMPDCKITEIISENGKGTGTYTTEREELTTTDCTVDQDAYRAYVRYREALRKLIADSRQQDLDGNYSRLADKAIRIAGLVASLENNNRITLPIWALAQQICEMFRQNLHELYHQINSTVEENPVEDALIMWMKKNCAGRRCTAREIIQRGPIEARRLKTDGIRALMKSMAKDGLIEIHFEKSKELYSLVSQSIVS